MLLITDTGPLTHASQTGHVGFLERILAPWTCAYPMQVRKELEGFDGNRAILEAKWIGLLPLDLKYDILAMKLRDQLGGEGTKNLGEAQCIALALSMSDSGQEAEIYADDEDGRQLALDNGLEAWTTTEILRRAVLEHRCTVEECVRFIDDVRHNGYRGIDVPSGQAFVKGYLPKYLWPEV